MDQPIKVTQTAQQVQPQKPEKPASIKILQFLHLILGLALLIFTITNSIIFFLTVSHLFISYSLFRYQSNLIRLGFWINLLLFLIVSGTLIFFLFIYKVPTSVECLAEPCPLVSFYNPRPVVIKYITPLVIFDLISLFIIWKNLKGR